MSRPGTHPAAAAALALPLLSGGAAHAQERLVDAPARGGFNWPSQPPADCPFERSTVLGGIWFSGRHSDYHCGDTFYPSWARDGRLYSPWTDGTTAGVTCSSGAGAQARTGHAVLIGDDPLALEIRNTSDPVRASALPYQGRYPCGSLVHDGVWYYGTYCLGPAGSVRHDGMDWNWPVLGPMPGFRVSTDGGVTWTPSPHSPERPLFPEPREPLGPVKMGAPHFVDFGRDMQHSPDGKAYLLGMGAEEDDPSPRYANLSWISADQVYLARVTPSVEAINDLARYEFFAGHDERGAPLWSSRFEDLRPLLEWNDNMGCVTATWIEPLGRYLMCVTDGWPTVARMSSYVLEAERLTGPWRLVAYLKDFGQQAYFLNFPSKFAGDDGRTLWLCYSANFSQGWNGVRLELDPPGGRYGLCLHELRLLAPDEEPPESPPNALQDPANVAPDATVSASSTHPGYGARGAVDRAVGGYPGSTSEEWASQGEAEGAWIRLEWARPVTVDRVWLFDRPNALDRVTAGRVELDDGTTLELTHALPDAARRGVELQFPARPVRWLRFVVTGVQEGSPNVGLAELAVFEATGGGR